ncbi:hypothetical protein B0O99DRAFT_611429 [Bisporella sp. PMI_857]|nr:hypothetical protein B0O99DRAFT_611429 [Bisporella sp. PMI_857]
MTAESPFDGIKDSQSKRDAHNAALRGASFAFGKPALKPKPEINTYSGRNGALAAAAKVGLHTPTTRLETPSDEHLVYQKSGGSTTSVTSGAYTPSYERRSLYPLDQSKSPSFIAATLAASRSVTPNHTGQQITSPSVQRPSNYTGHTAGSIRSMSSRESLDQPLDTSSIPPTTSLISRFEQEQPRQTVKKKPPVKRVTPSNVPSSLRDEAAEAPVHPELHATSPSSSQSKVSKSKPKPKPVITSPKPTLPPTFAKNAKPSGQPVAAAKPLTSTTKPIPIPATKSARPTVDNDASSDDSFVSASDYTPLGNPPSFRVTLQEQKQMQTNKTSPTTGNTSAAAVESLANAIVASSLATSRAGSPAKSLLQPPPLPAPRRSPHKHLFHNGGKELSRTPSPAKPGGLRTTMRKPREEEEDEQEKRRGRKNLMKKHPNKHHEGDRKRWRDQVTERERKRYEAVWASNRGLHLESGHEGEVCNLVAKDIFSRSRLYTDVLEEVYALIDRKQTGTLDREEFVVGLWLIDQRLKGRKLPIRVSESVWRSVGVLGGIKVRKVGK